MAVLWFSILEEPERQTAAVFIYFLLCRHDMQQLTVLFITVKLFLVLDDAVWECGAVCIYETL